MTFGEVIKKRRRFVCVLLFALFSINWNRKTIPWSRKVWSWMWFEWGKQREHWWFTSWSASCFHAHTHTDTHSDTHPHTQIPTHTHRHPPTHTTVHTCTHTHTHTHTFSFTHIVSLVRIIQLFNLQISNCRGGEDGGAYGVLWGGWGVTVSWRFSRMYYINICKEK